MINNINANRRCHILTIEDPIEILHPTSWRSWTSARSVIDTATSRRRSSTSMRQDPDVIFVGEIRDPETVKAAL